MSKRTKITIKIVPMTFLLSQFDLNDGASVQVFLITKPLDRTVLAVYLFPLPRCGSEFYWALAKGSSPLGIL
jgi:hypothetical protein